jgi:hypothetical protein
VLPRPGRRQIALLAALVALAGCAGDERAPETQSDEIRWLERLSRWESATDEASEEAFSTYEAVLAGERRPEALTQSLGPIRRCSRRLRDDVGEAPRRYVRGYRLILKACGRYERYAEQLERSFAGSPGEALVESEAASEEADRLIILARRAIESGLTANRELPRVGGVSEQSRVDPLFSRVASAVVGRDVEVVCWSRDEWPKVLKEWGAYIGTTDLGAFAHYDGDRVYLGPEYCEGLVDLAYRRERPRGGRGQREIADGVATLAHEAEHLFAAAASEAETECYAMQDIRRVARLLGAPPRYADTLAEVYWDELYETLPDSYVSPDCYDGGDWDREHASPVWP